MSTGATRAKNKRLLHYRMVWMKVFAEPVNTVVDTNAEQSLHWAQFTVSGQQ